MSSEKIKENKWKYLGRFLLKRLKSPLGQPEFVFYFLLIVILIGGNGIWYSWWVENKNCVFSHKAIIISLVSYAVALTSSGSSDLILSKIDENRNTIIMTGITLLILSLILFIFAAVTTNICFGYIAGGISVLISLVTWWIASAIRPELNDSEGGIEENYAPVGGLPSPGPGQSGNNVVGNLSGLKS